MLKKLGSNFVPTVSSAIARLGEHVEELGIVMPDVNDGEEGFQIKLDRCT